VEEEDEVVDSGVDPEEDDEGEEEDDEGEEEDDDEGEEEEGEEEEDVLFFCFTSCSGSLNE
jgi:hypothetical protein